jgi:hypothetical protein
MTPSSGPPKKGLLLLADDKNGPPPLSSPDEPDADDVQQPGSQGSCADCVFYDTSEQNCKRYPDWIPHAPDDYCGEYKAGKPHDSAGAGAAPQSQPTSAPPSQAGPYTKQQF